MITHHLKTWPRYWDAIAIGEKTFECRRDDQGYQNGDTVVLLRTYTNDRESHVMLPEKKLTFRIGFVLHGGQFGIQPGWCVFSLLPMEDVLNAVINQKAEQILEYGEEINRRGEVIAELKIELAAAHDAECPKHPVVVERDLLRAQVADLREALDTARVEVLWIKQNSAAVGTDSGVASTHRAATACHSGISKALAETPAASLAAVKAAVLREARGKMHRDQTWCQVADMLTDMADALDAKEADNARP